MKIEFVFVSGANHNNSFMKDIAFSPNIIHLNPHCLKGQSCHYQVVGNTPLIQISHIRDMIRRNRLIASNKKKQQRPPKSTQCWKTFKRLFSKQSNANHLQKPSLSRLSAVMKLSSPRLQSVVCAGNFCSFLKLGFDTAVEQLYFLF